MAALLQTQQQPLLIQLPNGQLVPAAGGALVDSGQAAPIAANSDNSGALATPMVKAAGSGGALVAGDDPNSNILRMPRSRGGAASTAMLPVPKQPEPMVSGGEGGGGGGDIGALIKALGAAAGKGGSDPMGPVNVTPEVTSPSSPGILDQIKGFLGLDSGKTNTVASTSDMAQAGQNNMSKPVEMAALDPINQGPGAPTGALANGPAPTPAQPGVAIQPQAEGGALAAPQPQATTPIAAPSVPVQNAPAAPAIAAAAPQKGLLERLLGNVYDKGATASDPLVNTPEGAATMAGRYGDDYKSPDWFDRLKANGGRMALLTGGLGAMAEASRPGATVGGAIGKGALSGINSVYAEREAQRAEDLAQSKETSEAGERAARADYERLHGTSLVMNSDTNAKKADTDQDYKGALGAAAGQKADAATTTANARSKSADAAMVRAQNVAKDSKNPTAFMKNAQWMVDNGMASDVSEAAEKLKTQAKNPGQRSALITARAKMLIGANIAPTQDDISKAQADATQQIDGELASAAPARVMRKGGALADVAPGGKPQAPGALPPPPPSKAAGRAQAEAAIAKGANRDQVIQRAKKFGIDTTGL